MKHNLTTLALALFLSILFSGVGRATTDVVIYSDDSYPPYSYKDGDVAKGAYVAVLKKVFPKMKEYNVRIEPVPWKRGLSYVEEGEGLAIFPPYYRPKERPWMQFSEPILTETVVVFCRDKVMKKDRPAWPEDYYGLIIGRNTGFSIGGEKFEQAVKAGKINMVEYKSNAQNILTMAKSRMDCYVNDKVSILWELKQLKGAGKYSEGGEDAKLVEGATIASETGHLGFTAKDSFPFKNDFLQKFNAILAEMKKSGEIQKIIDENTR